MTTRRGILTAGLVAGAGTLLAGPARAALPVVDMEAALKAAQWDPEKSDTGITPGAKASVLLIEQALVARGLLATSYADGHFGSKTVAAYAAWQRSLGYSGIGANGLPGAASLTALGRNRFTVRRTIAPGTKSQYQGWTVNARTLAMLRAAENRWGGGQFVVEQGSYAPGVDPTSAGSHDGGGALDLDAEALSPGLRTAALVALREVGFAAWLRNPSQANWPWHIHAIAISDPDLAPLAARQAGAYYEGRNGLASNLPDDGPAVPKVTYEEFRRGA